MRRRGPDISRFVVKVYLCLNQNINSHKAIKGAKGAKWGKGGKYFLWPDVMTVENRVEATVVLVIRINLNYSQLIKTS